MAVSLLRGDDESAFWQNAIDVCMSKGLVKKLKIFYKITNISYTGLHKREGHLNKLLVCYFVLFYFVKQNLLMYSKN